MCAAPTMPPEPASAPESLGVLIAAFVGHLRATGRADDRHYARAAERFFARWPDPPLWAAEPLEVRLAARTRTRMLVTFLMLHGHLRPGYDYLIARRFISLWRELATSPLRDDMDRFVAATRELGFADTVARGAGSLVAVRLLVQTGKPLAELTAEDLDEFESALGERDQRTRRPSAHYRRVLFTTRSTLYHLGILDRPPVLRPPRQRQPFAERLAKAGVPAGILASFVAYVERLQATHVYSTICGTVTHLGLFRPPPRSDRSGDQERRRARSPPAHRDVPDRDRPCDSSQRRRADLDRGTTPSDHHDQLLPERHWPLGVAGGAARPPRLSQGHPAAPATAAALPACRRGSLARRRASPIAASPRRERAAARTRDGHPDRRAHRSRA